MGSQPFSLLQSKGQITYDGVRNFTARNNIRDKIQPGQHVFYYHASCGTPAIIGIAEVASKGPDPCAADPKHPFYDPKHSTEQPRWFNLQLRPVRGLKRPVSLAEIRDNSSAGKPLEGMALVKQSRLSVGPVTDAEWAFILSLEDREPPSSATGSKALGSKKTEAAKPSGSSSSSSSSSSASESGSGGGGTAGKKRAAGSGTGSSAAQKRPRKAES